MFVLTLKHVLAKRLFPVVKVLMGNKKIFVVRFFLISSLRTGNLFYRSRRKDNIILPL